MISLTQYLQRKKKVEEAQQKVDRAEGALEQLMRRLKDEFKCSSLAKAKVRRKALKQQVKSAEEEYKKASKKFERKWSDEIQ